MRFSSAFLSRFFSYFSVRIGKTIVPTASETQVTIDNNSCSSVEVPLASLKSDVTPVIIDTMLITTELPIVKKAGVLAFSTFSGGSIKDICSFSTLGLKDGV